MNNRVLAGLQELLRQQGLRVIRAKQTFSYSLLVAAIAVAFHIFISGVKKMTHPPSLRKRRRLRMFRAQ